MNAPDSHIAGSAKDGPAGGELSLMQLGSPETLSASEAVENATSCGLSKPAARGSAAPSHARSAPAWPKFAPDDGFYAQIRRRVDRYFEITGRKRRDCPRMYVKSAIILAWFAASYLLLVFGSLTWWLALPAAFSMALALAGVGFNIQHDGAHGAYSDRRWINRLAGLTLELIGGSSWAWSRKHNAIHHSFTNVDGYDDDINLGFIARMSPEQKRLSFHRLQHYYLWVLYGFLTFKWHLYDDFRSVIVGEAGGQRFPRPRGWDLATFIVGRGVFFSLAFVIPMLFHPVWIVMLFYALSAYVAGLTLAIVFQLAHCVEEADFPKPDPATARIENAWAVHQTQTTVDFAPRSRLLSWYVGGLNHQIEHHLFPHVCHVNYAAIARLVMRACRRFGVKYSVNDTLCAAVASHFRWLRRMGMADAAEPALQSADVGGAAGRRGRHADS